MVILEDFQSSSHLVYQLRATAPNSGGNQIESPPKLPFTAIALEQTLVLCWQRELIETIDGGDRLLTKS